MRFRVPEHLHQWYSIFEIMASSSLKLRIMPVIGSKEYCKLKNKFWNASKNTTRRLATEVGTSQSVVHRTFKEKAYHVQKVQVLEFADFPRRVTYCEWLFQQCRERPF